MPDSDRIDSSSPALDPASSRVGTWLKEKWQLDRLIGIGGMASVYEATHRNGNRVAIKILHPQLSVNDEIRARFLREGYVANRVEHPGAVSVLDDDVTDDGAHFLVMTLLVGETLDAHMREHGPKLEPLFVLSVVDQVLAVLANAHERGIVHRDIKPENIFLTETGSVKVLDFGIARLRELATPGNPASVGTQTGLAMGTPGFMPPEQARGRWDEVDARSDLWAVGATLFAALSGTQVHLAQTVNELLLAAMTQPAPSLQSVFPSATGQLALLVDRALAFHKEQRFEDARQMQAQLRDAQRSLGLDVLPPAIVIKPLPAIVPVRVASPTAVTAQAPAPGSVPGVVPLFSSTPQPVSVSDARAVLEQAGRDALISATTVHEARVVPPVHGTDALASKPSSSGKRRVTPLLVAMALLGGIGAMFAYPEAPMTLRVRSMLSPLLYRGAEAIAPEPSASSVAEPQLVAARTTEAAPAEPLRAEPAVSASAAAPASEKEAPAAEKEPPAEGEDEAEDEPVAEQAPAASVATAHSTSAPHARPTPHVAGVARGNHTSRSTSKGTSAKTKPKWQAPPSSSSSTSKKKPKR